MEAIILPPFDIIPKPKYSSPCNGCGWCCHSSVCYLGQEAFKIKEEETPCPAMIFIDNKVRCGLVEGERIVGGKQLLSEALGIGKGCDADDFTTEAMPRNGE